MSKNPGTVGFFTLGCKVNQYETEALGELFEARGFRVLPSEEICDVYIINTCTVTAESDRKARQIIRRAITRNPAARILVTGCLTETDPRSIAAIPGVDGIIGNSRKSDIVDLAAALLSEPSKPDHARMDIPDITRACFEPMRITKFDRTRAYIKIEDGCESRCAYCIIPKARGAIRSKTPGDVLDEVRGLVAGGCREIVLTGIETASYGKDLDSYTLADLLEEIDAIPGIGRVRLGSLDPSLMKDAFVRRIAPLRSLAPHFHISMQSGSDHVLAGMKRKYNTRMALENIERLRSAIPGVMFTTDMIVGFPGESDEDFAETLAFVRRARFLMIHVFPYSRRRGTVADTMPDQIPEAVKHKRAAELSALAAEIRRDILEERIRTSPVAGALMESFEDGYAYGHTDDFIEVRIPSDRQRRAEYLTLKMISTDGTVVTAEPI